MPTAEENITASADPVKPAFTKGGWHLETDTANEPGPDNHYIIKCEVLAGQTRIATVNINAGINFEANGCLIVVAAKWECLATGDQDDRSRRAKIFSSGASSCRIN